jgi:hypothetical protein
MGLRTQVRRFRSLAVIQNGRAELISRNGNSFKSFEPLRKELKSPYQGKTVLDGEIVCLDKRGKPQFRDLLFHRGEPYFFAFDLLMSDGEDLRPEKLADRKQKLKRLLSTAQALATEVYLGDPSRFAKGKNVANIGMIPCEHTSGKRQRLGKLTKELAAALSVDRSDYPCGKKRSGAETLLSSQAHPERDGQGADGGGAQTGYPLVDHVA